VDEPWLDIGAEDHGGVAAVRGVGFADHDSGASAVDGSVLANDACGDFAVTWDLHSDEAESVRGGVLPECSAAGDGVAVGILFSCGEGDGRGVAGGDGADVHGGPWWANGLWSVVVDDGDGGGRGSARDVVISRKDGEGDGFVWFQQEIIDQCDGDGGGCLAIGEGDGGFRGDVVGVRSGGSAE